jgi:hypothetical protein
MTRQPPRFDGGVAEPTALYGSGGWLLGDWRDYDREHCMDLFQLRAFLEATQPKVAQALDLGQDGPTRRQFLARLQGEITKRGTIDVLRHGVKHGPLHLDLFYGTPPRPVTRRPSAMPGTGSLSAGSSATAATKRSSPSIWASSSTTCRSPPSS